MMRRRGATPNAWFRKERFVERVRSAGARSADGGCDEDDAALLAVVDDGTAERVANVEIREYVFNAERTLEVTVEVMMVSERSLRFR